MTTVVKTSLKNNNLWAFKLYRVYLNPLILSNPGVEFLRTLPRFKKRGDMYMKYSRMFTCFINHRIRRFHVVVVQRTSKECTKKCDVCAELLFWSLHLLLFWSRRCGRHRSRVSSLLLQEKWCWPLLDLRRSKDTNIRQTLYKMETLLEYSVCPCCSRSASSWLSVRW